MSIRERRAEVALLRTIGYPSALILRLLVSESVVIALLGGALGCGAAFSMLKVFAVTADAVGPFGTLRMPPAVLAQSVGIALLIGLVSAFVPAWTSSRANIVDALRRVD
jgi:putative ABC transport system permease protein